jgi:AcrR family transcriptional regulator
MSEIVQAEKRVDPRIKRTRQWLHQALLALMGEKSFEAITVQDVAERAGVNRATFYAHFPDKYALLEHSARLLFQEKLHTRVPPGAAFSPEHLAALIELVAQNLVEIQGHCPPPRGQIDTLLEKQVKAELYEVILGWLNPTSSPGSGQPTAEQAAMMASWAIYGAAVQWSQKDRREPAGDFAHKVLPLILAGLQPFVGAPAESRPRRRAAAGRPT